MQINYKETVKHWIKHEICTIFISHIENTRPNPSLNKQLCFLFQVNITQVNVSNQCHSSRLYTYKVNQCLFWSLNRSSVLSINYHQVLFLFFCKKMNCKFVINKPNKNTTRLMRNTRGFQVILDAYLLLNTSVYYKWS